MNHWNATGWLTQKATERVTPSGRHLLRWHVNVRDRGGKTHVHLCEAQGGLGAQDVPLGTLLNWSRLLTPGRGVTLWGEATTHPKRDRQGNIVPGSYTVMQILGCEFHDRSHPGEASPALATAAAAPPPAEDREPTAREELGYTEARPKWPPREPSPLTQFLEAESGPQPKDSNARNP